MAKVKLTKITVEAATFGTKAHELRDTVVPGFLLKVTPAGRKIFMIQYRTNAGARRKPAIGRFGELTVEQARSIARDWLADVRKGKDPSAEKTASRAAPSVKELCTKQTLPRFLQVLAHGARDGLQVRDLLRDCACVIVHSRRIRSRFELTIGCIPIREDLLEPIDGVAPFWGGWLRNGV